MIKKNIVLMLLLGFLQAMVFYAPIATLYRQAQGITLSQITIIESICLALCLLLELPWGIVADKIGYKRTMIFCSLLYFVSKIIFWQAHSFEMFLLERILLAVVISGLSGVDNSILYLSCAEGQSQRIFGISEALQTLGLSLSALIYSVFIKDNYPLASFLTVVSYGLAALLPFFLDEVSETKSKQRSFPIRDFLHLLKQTLSKPSLLFLLVAIAFFNETHQTITTFLSQPKYLACGISLSVIGYLYILLSLLGLFSAFSEKISKHLGISRFAKSCFLIAISACGVLAVSGQAIPVVISIFSLRMVFSLFSPLQAELQNKQVSSSYRATELSIYALIMDCVGIATNLSFGWLADQNLSLAFLFGFFLCLFGVFAFCKWYHTTK